MTQYLDEYMKCNEFVRDWRIVQTTELPQEYIISRYNAQWMHRIHFEWRYSFFNEYLRIINLKLKMQTKSCLGFDFIYICIVYVKKKTMHKVLILLHFLWLGTSCFTNIIQDQVIGAGAILPKKLVWQNITLIASGPFY